MEKDQFKEFLESIGRPILGDLERGGITRSRLIQKLNEELEATEVKIFNQNGKIISGLGGPAWEIRQRARMDIFKLMGCYPIEEHRIITGEMITSRSPEEIEKLREISKRVIDEIVSEHQLQIEQKED